MYERSYRSTWSSTFFLRRHRLKTRRTADSLSSLKSPVRLVIRRPQFWWTQRREKNEVIGWEANQSSLLNCFQLTLTLVWWAIGIEWCPSVSEWMSEWVSEWVSVCVSEWVSGWASEWVSEWVSERASARASDCVGGRAREWVSGCVSE